ncbi:MAG: hypothetical protein FWG89_01090 [Treponema sp.]|nr:hypothetical protein [Treponema sp.]
MKTRKKHGFLTVIAAYTILFCYACSMPVMPKRLIISSDKFTTNLPGTFGEFNLVKTISERLKDSLPEGFQMYDVVNYNGGKAILIGYEMDLVQSFNPDDYLSQINGYLDDIDDLNTDLGENLSAKLDMSELTWEMPEKNINIDISDLFDNLEALINQDTSGAGNYAQQIPFPLVPTAGQIPVGGEWFPALPKLPQFSLFDNLADPFESVFITDNTAGYDNKIELTVALTQIPGGSALPNGLILAMNNITLKGDSNGNIIGSIVGTNNVILQAANGFTNTITVDLTGAQIFFNDPPNFYFGDITYQYSGETNLQPVYYNLNIQPKITNIGLSGATGLKTEEITIELSNDIIEDFDIDISGFLNAQISEGEIEITAKVTTAANGTYLNGEEIKFSISMEQEPVLFDALPFNGLTSATPWVFTANEPFNFAQQTPLLEINNSTIKISRNISRITINSDNGIDFKLFGEHLTNKTLPIYVGLDMQINKLLNVHWKTDILPTPDDIEIDFEEAKIPQFIESITFDKMDLRINMDTDSFPPELNNVFAVKLESSIFKNGAVGPTPLTGGDYRLVTIDDINPTINIHDVSVITIKVEIVPGTTVSPGTNYIRIPELSLTDSEPLVLEGDISVEFGWAQAAINLDLAMNEIGADSFLAGTFPEKTKDPYDLKDLMSDYMANIILNASIDAKLFLNGPNGLINVLNDGGGISLEFDLEWDGKPAGIEMLYNGPLAVNNFNAFPQFSDEEYIYRGNLLPALITDLGEFEGLDLSSDGINSFIQDIPNGMRFSYTMKMPADFIVTPDMFRIDDPGSGIKALFATIIPLEFIAQSGAELKMPGIFDEDKDLFGRKDISDPVFGDVNLNSMNILLDFGMSFISEANLHINCSVNDIKLFGNEGIRVGKDSKFEITLNNSHWDTINNHLIYPDISITFPPGATISIPKNVMPIAITISAGGSVTINL